MGGYPWPLGPNRRLCHLDQDFLAFCEAEFERRRDTGEEFDEASYKEAMDLVVRKFQALDEEMGL